MRNDELATRDCDCKHPRVMSAKRPERCELHGNRFLTRSQLEYFDKPRKPLAPVSKKRQAEEEAGARKKSHGSTLKRSKGFEASSAQRAKVKLLPCLACGYGDEAFDTQGETGVDPAHVWPRSKYCDGWKTCADRELPLDEWCLPCLVPHLQRMYFARFREAVLSEKALQAAHAESSRVHSFHPYREITQTLLEAALTKAQEIMEEGGDRGD